ncbi:TPA: hypothetical protein QDZ65_001746 [Stenotrophomonas maltophilia]|nr:hypothetical protein [Stenotrophomonas maltophilia]
MNFIFDHKSGVTHPSNDILTLGMLARQDSLMELVRRVRHSELNDLTPSDRWMGNPCPYPFVYGAFSWYATSLIAYLQLVRLADRLRTNPSELNTLAAERNNIKDAGRQYVLSICPEIKEWRDKFGAHAAAADPRSDDNVALLFASLMYPVMARGQRFYVGSGEHLVRGHDGVVQATHRSVEWSITESFEKLAPRFWPDAVITP